MGSNRADAIEAADYLNSQLVSKPSLADRVLVSENMELFSDFLTWFEHNRLPTFKISENTKRDYRQKFPHIHEALGNKRIDTISVTDVATFLDQFPAKQSNNYRALLSVLFKHALSRGLCASNPASATLKRDVTKIQQRLTIEAFYAIHKVAPLWLQNAMDLGLKTLQRRADLANLKWEQIHEGYIWVKQQKVEKHESGNLKIRVSPEIDEILQRCGDSVPSAYVIHREPIKKREAKGRTDPSAVLPGLITKTWTKTRLESGYYPRNADTATLPGFHEIRSLGAAEYEKKGVPKETVQALLGHTSSKMTDHYLKGHRIRWSEIDIQENRFSQNFPKIFPKILGPS